MLRPSKVMFILGFNLFNSTFVNGSNNAYEMKNTVREILYSGPDKPIPAGGLLVRPAIFAFPIFVPAP